MNRTTGTQVGRGNRALNADERKICAALGVPEEDYLKTVLEDEALKTGSGTGDASGLNWNQSGGQGRALNADERKICRLLGVSEEDYIKTALEVQKNP